MRPRFSQVISRRGIRGGCAGAARFGLLLAALLTLADIPAHPAPPAGPDQSPMPADWLKKYKLDPADPDIQSRDSDGDGFTNLEEFLGSTDPADKNSHPPYVTKLFLKKTIRERLRIKFDGRPKEQPYEINSFEINVIDADPSIRILKMGDDIAGTKYKITGFEEKYKQDENGIDKDVSELTIQNTETGEKKVLMVGENSDLDTRAVFKYFWKTQREFQVKPGATFALDPEPDISYRLLDFDKTSAKIVNVKTKEEITIPFPKSDEAFHPSDPK